MLGTTVNNMLFGQDVDPTGQITACGTSRSRSWESWPRRARAAGSWVRTWTTKILVLYTTVMKKLLGVMSIRDITVSAASANETSTVADAIAVLLRTRHRIVPGQDDDFTVRTAEGNRRRPHPGDGDDDDAARRRSPASR
ncbi:MAG: hypothetical protein QM736_11235 [Vicinamibacterales bacterium]